jgi:hypothetical protein
MNLKKYTLNCAILLVGLIGIPLTGQVRNRVGTTAANFLEIGIGSAGSAMGEAYVSMARDLSSIYWNPAGLGMMNRNSILVVHQPWIAGTQSTFFAAGLILPNIGTLAIGVNYLGYGTMDVTNVENPEGTGETFSPADYAFTLSYGRRLVQWFAFGASMKVVRSQIWHCSATAIAADLGVLVNTGFFSPTGVHEDGMRIGMSISNYGGRMQFDGIDLLAPVDPYPQYTGNYADARGKYSLNAWELPLIFRAGLSLHAFKAAGQRLTLSADALHPNNNSESINAGAEYAFKMAELGELYLRGGYKAVFMDKSEYGATFGMGVWMNITRSSSLEIGYAYKNIGLLGNMHHYEIGVHF